MTFLLVHGLDSGLDAFRVRNIHTNAADIQPFCAKFLRSFRGQSLIQVCDYNACPGFSQSRHAGQADILCAAGHNCGTAIETKFFHVHFKYS